jgi:hypothetical protein
MIPPHGDCLISLEVLLHVPSAAEAFYEYLDILPSDKEASTLFTLYADLRYYDKACAESENDKEKYELA